MPTISVPGMPDPRRSPISPPGSPAPNLQGLGLFVILKNVFRNDKRRAQHDTAYRNRLKRICRFTPARTSITISSCRRCRTRSCGWTGDHREVLMLIAVEGLRYEEAASVLNISVGTVKSRLSRARSALRALVRRSRNRSRRGNRLSQAMQEDREQAWLLLADLFFLDTEPSESDYRTTAGRLARLGVGRREQEKILFLRSGTRPASISDICSGR